MLNQFETIIEPFAALSLIQLQQIMQLRQQVFMLEQHSLYLDADNNDVNATHVMVYDGAKLAAYARIVAPEERRLPAVAGMVERQAGIDVVDAVAVASEIEVYRPDAVPRLAPLPAPAATFR